MELSSSEALRPVRSRAVSLAGRRLWARIRLQHVLFLAFIMISFVPVMMLAAWVERSAVEKETASVRDKHLLVARNLSLTLARYVTDVRAVFDLAAGGDADELAALGVGDLLGALSFRHVCILDADNQLISVLSAQGIELAGVPESVLAELRGRAEAAGGDTIITELMREGEHPVFFMLKSLPDQHLALGVLGTDYLRAVQKTIAFGDMGHAAIVDPKGRVIAHPMRAWEETSKELAGLPVVAAMMRGETGVATFYSPATKADMVAGYTAVAGVNWGIMVPQPMSELLARAAEVKKVALALTVLGVFVAGAISWCLAKVLARPIEAVVRAAAPIARGRLDTRVGCPPWYTPREFHDLAHAFDGMVADLAGKNAALVKAAHRAEAANRAKSEFLANMSHELRTPLNAIIGFSEIMRGALFGPIGNARYQSYAADIHTSATHLLQMINEILDLSKAESGAMEVQLTETSIGDAVDVATRLVRERADTAGLKLSVEIEPDLPAVVTDSRKLVQILLNLLSNAVKFTPRGGVIAVRAKRRGSALEIAVADTGIGIAAEDVAKAMTPFGQVESAFSRAHQGTGLGLPLSKKLAEILGGRLELRSRPSQGTTVKVMLPLEDPPAVAAA